jgi:hypothetical protein
LSCFSCTQGARSDLPLRERIGEDDHWRVAHASETAVPGWLVLVPLLFSFRAFLVAPLDR